MALNQDWVCILKIRLPKCPHEHGVAPCQSTSTVACDNTFNTCFDHCNFACGEQFIYLSTCILPPHFEICAFPILDSDSLQRSSAKAQPGNSFSSRKFIRMSGTDMPTDGWGLDPYYAQNGVIPIRADHQPGSLLGRLQQIHKYFSGYESEFMTGFCNQHISQFRREMMVIDQLNIKPHKCNGTFSLSLQDTLSLASDAQCPVDIKCKAASTLAGGGQMAYPTLGIELDGADGNPYLLQNNILLSNNFDLADIDNKAKFNQTQYLYIDDELIKGELCINQSNPVGYNFILKERGVCGTTISKHDPGTRVYLATHFENMHITEVITRLFCECSDLNQALKLCCDGPDYSIIDTDELKQYKCRNPLQFVEFLVLTKPESLKNLINNLEFIFGFSIVTDAACGTVKMQECLLPKITGRMLMCTEIETIDVTYNDDYQRVIIKHSPKDCTKKATDENAGEFDIITTEDSLLEPCNRKESRKINTKTVETRSITAGNRYVLKVSMYRFLRKHKCKTRNLRIRVSHESAIGIFEGDGITVESECVQRRDGSLDTDTIWEVRNVFPGKEHTDICVTESVYPADTERCITDDTIIQAQPKPCKVLDCPELF